MVKAVARMLHAWRVRMWVKIRHEHDRDTLSRDFLPSFIVNRIAPKAHICTSLDRLQQVIQTPQWAYFDEYGCSLLQFLNKAILGFDQIIEEREVKVQDDTFAVSDGGVGLHVAKSQVGILYLEIIFRMYVLFFRMLTVVIVSIRM